MALTEEEKEKAKKIYAQTKKHVEASKTHDHSNSTIGKIVEKKDYTPAAQKRKQTTSENIANTATNNKAATTNKATTTTDVKPAISAKAVSSEAEKTPTSYVPAAQKRKQAVSDQVYENVLKGEAYLQSEGEDFAKGLINRLRSAGGETVENVARVIKDNVDPTSYFGKTSRNVIKNNVAGNIGDLADTQLARVKEKTGDVGDFFVDVADSGANMASQAILSGMLLPGASAPIANKIFSGVQGVSSGTQKYVDTRAEGGSKEEAWQRGIGSGTVAAITEGLTGIGKTGISEVPGVNKAVTKLDALGAKNWLTNVLTTGLGEGGEEGLEYAFEYASDVIADLIYKGEIETDFDVAELFRNVLSGVVMGAGFGGVQGSVGRNIPQSNFVLNEETEAPQAPVKATTPQAENVPTKVVTEQEGPFANVTNNKADVTKERLTELETKRDELLTKAEELGAKRQKTDAEKEEARNVYREIGKLEAEIETVTNEIEHPNTVGAMESNPASYSYMQNNYGTYPEGESAARVVDSPVSTDGTNRVNRFNRTMQEAQVTPDELIPAFEKAVEDGTFSYEVATDEKALDKAKKSIIKNGYVKSIASFEGKVETDKVLTKNDLAVGEMLYAQAAQMGDAKTAMELASTLAQEFTKAGQAVQAARLLKKLTPEGRLYNAQKIADRFNEAKNRPAKQEDIVIDETLATELLTAKTEEEIEAAEEAIKQNIADQLVATKMDKWNAWRYLSMLGNPKTHIRNVMGNALFVPARALKNGIKAALETNYAAKHKNYERTTTTQKATEAQKKLAKESFERNKKQLASGGNYRFENDIEKKKKVFDNKLLEKAREKNSELLEKEDMRFLERAYVDSMAKYLRANNIDPETATEKQIKKAEDYAEIEAKKATYRDDSEVAKAIERFSRTNAITKLASDALLPFRKTPINILARGVEYSPVELVKALTYDMAKVKDGTIEPQKMLDHIASGLTGTGVVALGALLAHLGLISGGDDENDKVQNFGELQGEQNYAFNIGDYSYTLDWATPISMPLFVGVEAYNALKGEGFNGGDVFNATLDAISKTADPMIGLSMLQNVEKILSGNYGGEGSGIGNLIKEAVVSYVLQAFPTLGTQIAQTIDPKQRNAYYTDKTNNIPDILEIPLNRMLAKIPGASMLLPEKVDAWGRTKMQEENLALRIFENFASPGYISKKQTTEVDRMLEQLYKQTGDNAVLPSTLQKSFAVDGETFNLSAEDYVKAQKEKGQQAYNILKQLTADGSFKKLSGEDKAEIVGDVYSYSTVKGKQAVSDYEPTAKWFTNMEKAKEEGLPVADYLVNRNFYNSLEKTEEKSVNQQMIEQLIADTKTSAKQDVAILEYVVGSDLTKYKAATQTPEEILDLYGVLADKGNKEADIKSLKEKDYSSAEALAKYNVADGSKKYQDGEFKFGNATKQVAKANKLKNAGYDPEMIAKAANAVTSIGNYGTTKNYSTCVKMLKAVGITDEKFINAFWNVYVNG